MTRLRRYLPVLVYFAVFFAVVILHDKGVIPSEMPGLIMAWFGLAWLLVFIWRNRAGGPQDRANTRGSDWTHDASKPMYYLAGPGSTSSLDR